MTSHPTMQAALLEEYGASFRIATIGRPVAAAGQVLVRVAASGVNPLDTKIHAGKADHARHTLPAILGIDLAGTVVVAGPGVTRFRPGDEVFGMTGGVGGHQGSLASYAAVDADLLALKPANLSMREASVLPLVFITAWEGLSRSDGGPGRAIRAGLGGAPGASARWRSQIAHARGAIVFATGSLSSRETIERLGAGFIDRAEPVDAFVARLTSGAGFDLVYDTVGGAALDDGFAAVRRFGHVASALGWDTHALAPLSFACGNLFWHFHAAAAADGRGAGRIMATSCPRRSAWPRLGSCCRRWTRAGSRWAVLKTPTA